MDVMTAIMERRSVRSFTEQPVTDVQVEQILRAGMNAPSAGNAQPWEFVVIRNKETLTKITTINEYAAFAPSASVGILACGNLSLEKFKGYWVQDVSAAVENMLLAVHGLGLGAVWTGIYPMQDRVIAFQRLVNTPDEVIPLGLIVIGHTQSMPQPVSRFKPERIHNDTW